MLCLRLIQNSLCNSYWSWTLLSLPPRSCHDRLTPTTSRHCTNILLSYICVHRSHWPVLFCSCIVQSWYLGNSDFIESASVLWRVCLGRVKVLPLCSRAAEQYCWAKVSLYNFFLRGLLAFTSEPIQDWCLFSVMLVCTCALFVCTCALCTSGSGTTCCIMCSRSAITLGVPIAFISLTLRVTRPCVHLHTHTCIHCQYLCAQFPSFLPSFLFLCTCSHACICM